MDQPPPDGPHSALALTVMGTVLVGFAIATTLLILAPGPDNLLVMRNTLRGGRRTGLSTAAGTVTGLLIWAVAAALGLSALLQASRTGYDVLRFVGAGYLIWLGVTSLGFLRRRPGLGLRSTAPSAPAVSVRGAYLNGVLTTCSTPRSACSSSPSYPASSPPGSPPGVSRSPWDCGLSSKPVSGFARWCGWCRAGSGGCAARRYNAGSNEPPAWCSSGSASGWPPKPADQTNSSAEPHGARSGGPHPWFGHGSSLPEVRRSAALG